MLAFLIALAFAALGAFVGLRTGSGEAVQGLFPLFFVFLFLSSKALPRDADRAGLVPHDRDVEPGLLHDRGHPLAGHHGLGRRALERGFGVAIVLCAIGIVGASRALRTRLVRT